MVLLLQQLEEVEVQVEVVVLLRMEPMMNLLLFNALEQMDCA
jgi:hypothetical protein